MWNKDQVEKFLLDNADKIKQGKALLDLMQSPIVFSMLWFELKISTNGNHIVFDLLLKDNADIKNKS